MSDQQGNTGNQRAQLPVHFRGLQAREDDNPFLRGEPSGFGPRTARQDNRANATPSRGGHRGSARGPRGRGRVFRGGSYAPRPDPPAQPTAPPRAPANPFAQGRFDGFATLPSDPPQAYYLHSPPTHPPRPALPPAATRVPIEGQGSDHSQTFPRSAAGDIVARLRDLPSNAVRSDGSLRLTRDWAQSRIGLGDLRRSATTGRLVLTPDSQLRRLGANLGVPALFIEWMIEEDGVGGDTIELPAAVARPFWRY